MESDDSTMAARDLGGLGVVRLLVETEAGPGVDAGGGESELPFDSSPIPLVSALCDSVWCPPEVEGSSLAGVASSCSLPASASVFRKETYFSIAGVKLDIRSIQCERYLLTETISSRNTLRLLVQLVYQREYAMQR